MKNTEPIASIEIPSDPGYLKKIRQVVSRVAHSAGCSCKMTQDTVLAVNEAVMNIIQHAYQGDSNGLIILEIHRLDQYLEFWLTDYGRPACPDKIKPRPLDEIRPGGLGCHFIKEVMDEVEFFPLEQEKTGNRLRMLKRIDKNYEM